MLGKIAELIGGIPRMAFVVVVLLAIIGGVWFWRRRKSAATVRTASPSATDRETETIKADRAASQYADMIARGLPERREEGDAEMEEAMEDSESAVTDEYVKTVGADQEMSAEDDDEEYEPMDA